MKQPPRNHLAWDRPVRTKFSTSLDLQRRRSLLGPTCLCLAAFLLLAGAGSGWGQAIEREDLLKLEELAQDQYQEDNLNGAANSYLKLSRSALDGDERAGFALLAAWILHQDDRFDARDLALQSALRESPNLRPDPAAFGADFLQLIQELRGRIETSAFRRAAELGHAGDLAFERQDYSLAVRHYQELVNLEPTRATARLQLAVSQLNAGQPAAARGTLTPLGSKLELFEQEVRERYLALLTMANVRTGDTSQAAAAIRRISGPVQRQLWLELATALRRAGDLEDAVQALSSVLEIDPADRQSAILRSQLLTELGRELEAESFLLDLTKTLPESNAVWRELGVTREQLGDRRGALAAYRRAAGGNPQDPIDRDGYLQALLSTVQLLRTSDPEAAHGEADRALLMAPEDVDALGMKVRLLSDGGRHAEAIQLAKKAVALGPDRVDIRNLLGNSYYLAGRYPEAVTVFERLLTQHPELEAVQENLSRVQELVGSEEEDKPFTGRLQSPATSSSNAPPPASPPKPAQPKPKSELSPTPDPTDLPVGLSLAPFHWATAGRNVLRVESVETSSKANRCDLRTGDLLIRVQGQTAGTESQVIELLSGDTTGLRLDIVRDTEPMSLVCI